MRPLRIRVACMGDSLTRGDASHEPGMGSHHPFKNSSVATPVESRGNYPLTLGKLMGSSAYEVRNFGHGGRSVLPPTQYNQTAEYRAALAWRPHLVLLMLGTNDAKRARPGSAEIATWDADAFEPQLLALARAILHNRIPSPRPPFLLLLIPPPILPTAASSRYDAQLLDESGSIPQGIEAVARALASTGPPAVPCMPGGTHTLSMRRAWPGCPSRCHAFIGSDGIHTTAGGAEAMGQLVSGYLRSGACKWRHSRALNSNRTLGR